MLLHLTPTETHCLNFMLLLRKLQVINYEQLPTHGWLDMMSEHLISALVKPQDEA